MLQNVRVQVWQGDACHHPDILSRKASNQIIPCQCMSQSRNITSPSIQLLVGVIHAVNVIFLAQLIHMLGLDAMNEEELRQQLGKKVKYLRRLANLTQAQFAEKTNLSVNYVSEIETGTASPTIKTLLKLAQELNVEVKELFTFDD